jgi:hypothetical protein
MLGRNWAVRSLESCKIKDSDLLCKLEISIAVFVEVVEHMQAISLFEVINHVFSQEAVDVVSAYLLVAISVNPLEGSPWFEAFLFCKLDTLLFNNLLVFGDGFE